MISASRASKLIKKSKYRETVKYKNGDVEDIVQVILEGDKVSAPFTRKFAKTFKGPIEEVLFDIWNFTRSNISYVQDNPGFEKVKSPGATWKDRFGDCKSLSIFVGSILKNLKIPYKYRVAFYDANHPNQGHIYPIAIINGKEIIVDAVNSVFDKEETYWRAYDVHPGSQEGRIAGPPPSRFGENLIISLLIYYLMQ